MNHETTCRLLSTLPERYSVPQGSRFCIGFYHSINGMCCHPGALRVNLATMNFKHESLRTIERAMARSYSIRSALSDRPSYDGVHFLALSSNVISYESLKRE